MDKDQRIDDLQAENKSLKAENERLKEKVAIEKYNKKHYKKPNPVSVEDLRQIIIKSAVDNKQERITGEVIAQAIFDRIYKDKPKEYCTCEYVIVTWNMQDGITRCGKCHKPIQVKPIKTEKIEPMAKGNESPITLSEHISALYKKVDELIEYINRRKE